MTKYSLFTMCLLTIIVGISACKEDSKPDIEGLYVGETHLNLIWADPVDGYGNSDTTYSETIEVKYIGEDSIMIGTNRFLYNDIQQYFNNTGTQYSYFAHIKADVDSLLIQTYDYDGISPQEFTQTDKEFNGKKQ
ncbi:MAG: hypothetical protein IPM47_20115 [Sphingobacteriales bacterium]|nr:MAG: hypothetical protein IPM47_20115 [Sphingobacteriales bacterium]